MTNTSTQHTDDSRRRLPRRRSALIVGMVGALILGPGVGAALAACSAPVPTGTTTATPATSAAPATSGTQSTSAAVRAVIQLANHPSGRDVTGPVLAVRMAVNQLVSASGARGGRARLLLAPG
jgi:hypothetical protein